MERPGVEVKGNIAQHFFAGAIAQAYIIETDHGALVFVFPDPIYKESHSADRCASAVCSKTELSAPLAPLHAAAL